MVGIRQSGHIIRMFRPRTKRNCLEKLSPCKCKRWGHDIRINCTANSKPCGTFAPVIASVFSRSVLTPQATVIITMRFAAVEKVTYTRHGLRSQAKHYKTVKVGCSTDWLIYSGFSSWNYLNSLSQGGFWIRITTNKVGSSGQSMYFM